MPDWSAEERARALLSACSPEHEGEDAIVSLPEAAAFAEECYRAGQLDEHDRWVEREAAVCPEDVAFDDFIRAIRARAERAEAERDELRALLDAGERMSDTWRGHPMHLVDGVWMYSDRGTPVADEPDRPCGHCGLPNREDGHDACLGELPGVVNACCGHGDPEAAYVQEESEFAGQPREALCSVDDAGHRLTVRVYEFPDGTRRPYVEASETHEGAARVRVLPLPEVVHLIQNVTESELFAIGNREGDESE